MSSFILSWNRSRLAKMVIRRVDKYCDHWRAYHLHPTVLHSFFHFLRFVFGHGDENQLYFSTFHKPTSVVIVDSSCGNWRVMRRFFVPYFIYPSFSSFYCNNSECLHSLLHFFIFLYPYFCQNTSIANPADLHPCTTLRPCWCCRRLTFSVRAISRLLTSEQTYSEDASTPNRFWGRMFLILIFSFFDVHCDELLYTKLEPKSFSQNGYSPCW